jgi:hypothetical protein
MFTSAYSDLDLVVIYKRLPNAYGESFRFDDMPVEALIHDPTLNYFCGDGPSLRNTSPDANGSRGRGSTGAERDFEVAKEACDCCDRSG